MILQEKDQPDEIIKYGVEYFESIQEGKPFNFQSKSNIAKGQAIEKKHQLQNQKITQNKARKLLIYPIYDKSLKVSPQHLEQLSVRQPSVDYFNELFQKVEQDIDQFESSKSETSNAFFLPQQISQSKQGCQNLEKIIKIQVSTKGILDRTQLKQQQQENKL
ncbi:unnamed protein product [Paramecium octaurelia]|uniref:Uncharacterized protein n=1 Tax=Paramecium octaurelia TaxID=43137 RepID=A0A8S1YJY4_PAROT|nr:unnamed protein product [Paramecium octaurelia]